MEVLLQVSEASSENIVLWICFSDLYVGCQIYDKNICLRLRKATNVVCHKPPAQGSAPAQEITLVI